MQTIYTESFRDSQVFEGIEYERFIEGAYLVHAEVSMRAHEPQGGERVTSWGGVDIWINNLHSGHDGDYAHEHESEVKASTSCLYPFVGGRIQVRIKAATASNSSFKSKSAVARITLIPLANIDSIKSIDEIYSQ